MSSLCLVYSFCHVRSCKQYKRLALSCFSYVRSRFCCWEVRYYEPSFFDRTVVTWLYECGFSTSSRCRQCFSSEENAESKKSISLSIRRSVDNKGIPLSLLGDGFNKSIPAFRYSKKRKADQHASVCLPVAASSQLTHVLTESHPHSDGYIGGTNENESLQGLAKYPFTANQSEPMRWQKYPTAHDTGINLQTSIMPSTETEDNIKAAKEELWKLNDGTSDASVPVSNIACGGCGALFHCKDPSLPGYMHSEKFKLCSKQRLKKELCQRCIYLQHFNVALDASVSPLVYPKIISEIKDKNALVILIVDITDFPCSLWPGIVDLIGEEKPIFVIGNKVDLLPCDHKGYLQRIVSSLKESLKHFGVDRNGNIRHVCVVSAKTGYGIEELITKIHVWNKGDVYLVGCTNVGKSTLFNMFLASDLCKVQATDTVQHATISQWPGTTLNLLKFPILRMTGKRKYLRTKRLINERQARTEERKLKKLMYEETEDPEYATLTGRVGMTFKKNEEVVTGRKPFNPYAKEFTHGHFCYDTPGTVHEDQIINLLTVEELALILPKMIITPRTFKISKCQTLFVAGLARVDLIDSPQGILVTVFSSDHLPVHMVYTEQAEKFYNHYLGTEMLVVPCGSAERLRTSLAQKDIEIVGSGSKESCADVSLSSVGWISVTLGKKH